MRRNEDGFLPKSFRKGGAFDMVQLARASGFDWGAVTGELYSQELVTGRHFCLGMFESLAATWRREGIRAAFSDRLANHCVDQAVMESVGRGKATTWRGVRRWVDVTAAL